MFHGLFSLLNEQSFRNFCWQYNSGLRSPEYFFIKADSGSLSGTRSTVVEEPLSALWTLLVVVAADNVANKSFCVPDRFSLWLSLGAVDGTATPLYSKEQFPINRLANPTD